MTWIRKAWKWLRADWKRWFAIPALAVGVVAGCRWAWRRVLSPGRPPPAGAITPAEGRDAHDQVDAKADAELEAIEEEMEAAKRAGREKYGGGS